MDPTLKADVVANGKVLKYIGVIACEGKSRVKWSPPVSIIDLDHCQFQ